MVLDNVLRAVLFAFITSNIYFRIMLAKTESCVENYQIFCITQWGVIY